MQHSIQIEHSTAKTNRAASKNIISKYIAFTNRQAESKMQWLIMGHVLIPCVGMIISVFALHFLDFQYLAYYMPFTFLLFYAMLVTFVCGMKPVVFVSMLFLNILVLVGTPLLVLLLG